MVILQYKVLYLACSNDKTNQIDGRGIETYEWKNQT